MKQLFFGVVVLILLSCTFAKAQSFLNGHPNKQQTLESILNPDGTINTGAVYKGSFNAAGYSLVSGPGEPPRFVSEQEIAANKSLRAAGDEYWTDPFTGSGFNGAVRAIAVDGTDTYIGGSFTNGAGVPTANYIVKWDGYSWSALGSSGGLSGEVYTIAVGWNELYVGGNFSDVDGNTANNIARWDTDTWQWSTLGDGVNGVVNCIAIYDSIYVGGNFTDAGGNTSCDYIAKWDDNSQTWAPCKSGLNGQVNTIEINTYNGWDDWYIGGQFTNAGGIAAADRIVEWSNGNWYALGSGIQNGTVNSIFINNNEIFMGGSFTDAGGNTNCDKIAKWTGSGTWSALGTGLNNTVYHINYSNMSGIYAGGDFTNAGGIAEADYIAKWNTTNSTWSAVGSGITGRVYTTSIHWDSTVDHIFTGGTFTDAGGLAGNSYFSEFNGTAWYPFFSSTDGYVNCIAISGSSIYVGGNFTRAGDIIANKIAKWDGTAWSSLGNGIAGMGLQVNAIAFHSDGKLYVGGNFIDADGIFNADAIAKFDTVTLQWSAVGNGLNGMVNVIYTDGTNLYVGGNFTNAGGNASADYIAQWNGSTWSALGSGLNNNVFCLAYSGSTLYVGGSFTDAGGNANADYIAAWDGSSWSPVGNGLNSTVYDIETNGADLYVGGFFTDAGSDANADRITRLNGSAWTALGAGLSGGVTVISIVGTEVVAGGYFINAGGISTADYIAKWNGSSWTSMGSGIVGSLVKTLTLSENYLYVGGGFTAAGGKPFECLARWGEIPAITGQPSAQEVCVGNSASFSVSAIANIAMTYQWRKNGADMPGETGSALTFPSASLPDAGSYSCVVSTGAGNAVTNAVTLIVNSPINITQSGDMIRCEGESASFNVTATGTLPITFEWHKNSTPYTTGSSNGEFTINSVIPSDAGTFYCDITNVCGTVTSNNIILTVNSPVQITLQPATQSVCEGLSFSIGISVSGTAPISYQWKKDGLVLAGENSNTFSLSDVLPGDTGNYTCDVSNSCASLTSNTATLTVNNPISISDHTNDMTKCEAESVTFSVSANGTAPLSYQWKNNGVPVNGETGSNYTIINVLPSDADTYTCDITNMCGTVTSNTMMLTVNSPAQITVQPATQEVCEGNSVSFSITATGTSPIAYQWKQDGTDIAGEDNSTITLSSAAPGNAGIYTCAVSNSCANVTSNAATLTVNIPISISSQTSDFILCEAESVTFSVSANGTAPISYLWKKNGTPIIGETGSSFTIGNVLPSDAASYTCDITNMCGTETTGAMTLTVNSPVSIQTQPAGAEICETSNAIITILASGTSPIGYQWQKDGFNIPMETSSTLSLSNVSASDEGVYTCILTNVCSVDTAGPALLIVHLLPVVFLGNDTNICTGNPLTLDGGAGYTNYLWNTGTSGRYFVADTSGTYYVFVTDGHGCQNYSNSIDISVHYPYSNEEICIVTVDTTNGKNLIAWEKTPGAGTAFYNIYRETMAAGTYELIGTVPFSSAGIFTDTVANPEIHSWLYKISSVDTCGNESALSPHHRTLHLNVSPNGTGNGYQLSWVDHYEGFTFYTYRIFRGSTAHTMVQIDSIQNTLTSYTDTTSLPGTLYYFVAAKKLDTCYVNLAKTQTGPYSQSVSNIDDNGIIDGKFPANFSGTDFAVFPNPFKNTTTVYYILTKKSLVGLELYSVLGEKIVVSGNEIQNAGSHSFTLDGNEFNLAKGVYYLKLAVNGTGKVKKVITIE